MIKAENKLQNPQKRIIYIILVMIFLSGFFVLLYLIFTLINFQGHLIELDDKTAEVVGGIIAILGAIFGQTLGKKWWQIVYVEKGHGAFLKVKK